MCRIKENKKLGIIGGMGPESTALLYKYIIKLFQNNFKSYKDEDFPEILIHNLPIPDITINVKNEIKIKEMLKKSLDLFEISGVELIAFPCNSLDYFLGYIRAQTKIPIISIVEETCKVISKRELKEFTILSTPMTFNKGLYQKQLQQYVKLNYPKNNKEIVGLITDTMKGKYPTKQFLKLITNLLNDHNQIIIGCTDLSILVENNDDHRIIDSLKCLSQSIIDEYKKITTAQHFV